MLGKPEHRLFKASDLNVGTVSDRRQLFGVTERAPTGGRKVHALRACVGPSHQKERINAVHGDNRRFFYRFVNGQVTAR